MIEGLWIVQYEGVHGGDGGVIVFVNGQLLGGDNGFVYTGTYQSNGKNLSARVLVRNFAPNITNVMGIKGDFDLEVQGAIDGSVIKGSANLINQDGPGMVLKLSKVKALAP
ncbi:GrlR family regulatory protein [Alloacidobacterium sp.]|uniref:GrlR family regulatory protein n=1 Tax=Alloacidobacterium sp. TaxID=2951999 RepID=UPI002D42F3E8|nr:GrlR family regulatory protein [Alloacidobacterium sp.]HYK35684.1 GrlR family regulatory protein [Alloacidobacterium sp.]